MAQRTQRLTAEVAPERVERLDPNTLSRNELRSTPGLYRRAWRRYRRNKIAMVALSVFVVIVLFVLSADMLSRYVTHVTYWKGNLRGQFLAPFSEGHILGTDSNGRDVLTRLAYGGRVSLLVAGLAVLTTLTIGSAVGAIAGYFGGFLDSFFMRLVDVLLAIPGLPLLILIFALYRPNAAGLAIVLGLLSWAGVARLIRGEVLSIRGRDYVDAARVIGASNGRIIWRHIFPNIVPIIVVWISLAIPSVILAEAALSYLGFGVQVPTPSWGNMLQGAKDYYTRSWTNVFIPGFMIYITVLAINLVGNGLRDALDPRLND
ncbi:MAG: ABC transporter permease [Chloroflexota bacterium]|nr:ABC transporter permease [Chloroflexota bacterium]MDP9471924.1 ABC transporter permease [Chloroflexota bacterium]